MKRGEVAIHGEHTVGGNQRIAMVRTMFGQQFSGVCDIVMPEDEDPSSGQLAAGHDAGMGQLVDQD